MRYVKTVTITSYRDLENIQVGQWFKFATMRRSTAGRGQWLGKTPEGIDAVRMQVGSFGKPSDLTRNKLQRTWAKSKGAK